MPPLTILKSKLIELGIDMDKCVAGAENRLVCPMVNCFIFFHEMESFRTNMMDSVLLCLVIIFFKCELIMYMPALLTF